MLRNYVFIVQKFIITMLLLFGMGTVYAADVLHPGSVDFKNIIEAADFSNAAYQTEAEIVESIRPYNYILTNFHTIPEINITYFIATNDVSKTQFISIRGTSNIENTIIDISLKLKQDEATGLRLHEGFSFAARKVLEDLQAFIKKDYVINTTGHSLGGAVALILAMYMDTEKLTIGNVITFGQPKVTNVAGANRFKHLNITRVVTPLDLVPLVPPFDPLDINNLDIYWHAGKEILLLEDIKFSVLEGLNSMLRTTKFTQSNLSEENLKNHQMSFYLEKLSDKKGSAELVPFKNSFNLFNLFGN